MGILGCLIMFSLPLFSSSLERELGKRTSFNSIRCVCKYGGKWWGWDSRWNEKEDSRQLNWWRERERKGMIQWETNCDIVRRQFTCFEYYSGLLLNPGWVRILSLSILFLVWWAGEKHRECRVSEFVEKIEQHWQETRRRKCYYTKLSERGRDKRWEERQGNGNWTSVKQIK